MIESAPVKVDTRGRITLPKDIRESLNIKEGDTLLIKSDRDNVYLSKAVEAPINQEGTNKQ